MHNELHGAESFLSSLPSCAVTQEFLNILEDPKVIYHVNKSIPPAPILSQIHPVRTTSAYISKTHFNIIILPTHGSS
jgi:hypothetical protein